MGMIDGIVSLVIAVVLVANVYIFTVKNQSTTSWSTTETTLWGLLTMFGIIGLLYMVGRVFGIL